MDRRNPSSRDRKRLPPPGRSPTDVARGPKAAARGDNAHGEALVDAALVRRFNAGDESAFVEIMSRHRAKILALAQSQLRNHADAEEITQDTFIRAHRGLARFRGDSSLATWLHRIAINLARNRYWYFFRRRRHLMTSLDCPLNEETPGTFNDLIATPEADPARQATVDEFGTMVTTCMEKLDQRHREVLTLRNLLHRSYQEIAGILGINEGTVKSRIARARESLRGLMAASHPEFSPEATSSDWFEPLRATGSAR